MSHLSDVPVIMDMGTVVSKAGLANDTAPIAMFPTVIGVPRKVDDLPLNDRVNCFGETALENRATLTLKRLVECGLVTNWEHWQELIEYTYLNRLCVESSDHPVVYSEMPLHPRANREKMAQIFFEHFGVPAFYLGSHASFAMRSSGLNTSTGLVLDLGDRVIQPTPMYEGSYLPFCMRRSEIQGSDLLYCFTSKVSAIYPEYAYLSKHRQLMSILEQLAFVSPSYKADEARPASDFESSFKLPDGSTIIIDRARYQCMEPLFNPSLSGFETSTLPELVYGAIMLADPDVRADMAANILICGGYSGVPGLVERLEKELSNVAPQFKHPFKVNVHPLPAYSSWAGAREFANSPLFSQSFMTTEDYDEHGPSLVHRLFCCN